MSATSSAAKPLWLEELPHLSPIEGIHETYLDRYLQRVESGEVLVGRRQRLAVERFKRDLDRLKFEPRHVDRVVTFFCRFLKHSTGEYSGQPFEPRPWQVFILANLFGFVHEDGRRVRREGHICIGRGNGKSPFSAAVATYLGFYDGEVRASVHVAATKRDQARVVFDECCRFVQLHPGIASAIKQSRLQLRGPDDSTIEPISSDRNYDGLVSHGLILDELHAWHENFRDRYDKLKTGLGKRRQPMELDIGTAGDDLSEIWIEVLRYSDRSLDPANDGKLDHHFAFVCDIDDDLDILDEKNWVMANPMLQDPDSPVKIEYLRQLAVKAEEDAVAKNQFARYHANQMVTSTAHWLQPGQWEKGSDWIEPAAGQVAYGGFDLARVNDFAAIAVLWPVSGGYSVQSWAWTVEERSRTLRTAEFRRLLNSPYLTIHTGDQIDFGDIREKIEELSERFVIDRWAYDPAWARETAQLLENQGYEVEPTPQTALSFNEPLVRLRDLLNAGGVYHGGEPLLAWQAANLLCKLNTAGLSQPDRRDTEHKIDGIVSVLMAFRLALMAESPPEERFYDDHDLEGF